MSQLKRRKQDNSFEVVGDKSLPIRLLADGTAEDDSYVAIDNGTGARKCTAQQLVDATEVDATKVVDSTLNKTQAEINSRVSTIKEGTLSFGSYGGNPSVVRCGNIVTFATTADMTNIQGGVYTNIATMPSGYKPLMQLTLRVTNDTVDFRMDILINGTIRIYRQSTASVCNAAFNATWITEDDYPTD